MRVLHVIDSLGVGGGAEHSLAATLPLLRELGVQSNIACLVGRTGGLQEQLRSEGFDVEILAGRSRISQILSLRAKIKVEMPDLVHSTLFNSCLVTRVGCLGLKPTQINSLVTTSYDPIRISQLKIPRWKLLIVRKVDEFTARYFGEYFHAVTETVKREGVNVLHISGDRITVIPRGRSRTSLGSWSQARRRKTRQALGIDEDAIVLLSVGRQDGAKNQSVIIESFSRVYRECPNTQLLIAGRTGDATPEVDRALDHSPARDAITMLGHRDDVPDLLVAADMLVFPSLYEGIGGVMLEAMALGTPIIGSDADGIVEVLDHGRFGVITPRDDPEVLSRAILGLVHDEQRRKELADLGQQRFLERFEISRVADLTAKFYERCLETQD